MRFFVMAVIWVLSLWLAHDIGIAKGYIESGVYYELAKMGKGDEVRIKQGSMNTILTCTRKFEDKKYCFGGMTIEIGR